MLSSYQQSFRIDDLLTRKAVEQQPDHFGTLSSPTKLDDPPAMGGKQAEKVGGVCVCVCVCVCVHVCVCVCVCVCVVHVCVHACV